MQNAVSRSIAAAAFAVAFAVGCSDPVSNDTTPNGDLAELKVTHATEGVGALTVEVGDQVVISNLQSGRSSAPTEVPAGMQRVKVRQGTTVLADLQTNLTTAHLNVLTMANGVAQVASTVISDTGQAATNRANIRLINVASGNETDPTHLQVLVNFPGVSPDSTAKLGMDTKIASHGTLMYFDPGDFRFRFVPNGSTNVLTEVNFSVAAGEKRAVVLERAANGTYQAKVVVEQ